MAKGTIALSVTAGILVGLILISTQPQAGEKPSKIVNTETLLVFIKATMKEGCEAPDSKLACWSKDLEQCRRALNATTDACVTTLRESLPEEIDLGADTQVKGLLVRCVIDEFVTSLGPENIFLAVATNSPVRRDKVDHAVGEGAKPLF